MAKSLPSSKSLRAGLRAAGKPDRWDMEKYSVKQGYDRPYVQMHAVQNTEWQQLRLRLKGLDTADKLQILQDYWNSQNYKAGQYYGRDCLIRASALRFATEVQVGNYLGALRRGGQLDDENRVRRAR